ncbi:DUF4012 domain-containing protein [Arthrobacter sp. ZGTC131]|uniref:DUF4012 domain-containing protein n=1 Tax=Arthrobacter sp. ZGTC131 TaxID=2058898 RepID=UPI00215832A4|nr:DUF4012 domain-containing protein [Arthrobacter sp. ZGTC131]
MNVGLEDNGDASSGTIRRTRTGATSRRKRNRRLLMVAAWTIAVIGLLGAATVWLSFKATIISAELKSASQLLSPLRASMLRNDVTGATLAVDELKLHTAKAHAAATDPIWTIAGSLPWLGRNFQAASEVAASADDIAGLAAVPLVDTFQSLNWASLAPKDGRVDLLPLTRAAPKLSVASHAVTQSLGRLNAINADELLPPVATPLLEVRNQLASLGDGLETAADAAAVAPGMMGADGPRRYLLLIQNNAEARASGGIPGAVAVLTLDRGKLSLGEQKSAADIGVMSPTLAVNAEQQQIYSPRLGKYMQDVNLTPDFPTAASTAQAMWERKTGQRVDGVVSIDPIALGYVLDATGAVKIRNPELVASAGGRLPTELTGNNVVPTLLSDVYAKIEQPKLQDAYFAGVAQEIFAALSSGRGDAKNLVAGIVHGAAEGRVLLWSDSDNEQTMFAKYPLSGSIAGPSVSPAQFGVYFNDGTGAKMDYHVKRTVQLIEECPAGGYSEVKVRITSTNAAPKDAAISLPEYVTGGGAFGVPAGSVQTNIIAYGPVQSNVETAFVEGKKTGFASHQHGDRPVGSVTVRLAPGQSSTVDFTFGKIVQHTEPKLSVTPTVQALTDVVLDTIPAKCVPAS